MAKTLSEAQKTRIKAGRLLQKGLTPTPIAAEVGVARQTIHTWQRILAEKGFDALKSVPEVGRPASVTPSTPGFRSLRHLPNFSSNPKNYPERKIAKKQPVRSTIMLLLRDEQGRALLPAFRHTFTHFHLDITPLLINEKRRRLTDPATGLYPAEQREKFLAGEAADHAEGYVPPKNN